MTWKQSESTFKDPPLGLHLARCIWVVDLGTQKGEWMGKPKLMRKTFLRWELPTKLMAEGDSAGKPFVIGRFYTASLSEKSNLRKDLVNWRGKDFTVEELNGYDEKNLLDKLCQVNVTADEHGKVRVTAVMPRPDGVNSETNPRVNDLLYFSLERDRFNADAYAKLPKGMTDIIQQSPEWADLHGVKPGEVAKPKASTVDPFDDDIPF